MNQLIKNTFDGVQKVKVATLCVVCILFFMAAGCGEQRSAFVAEDNEQNPVSAVQDNENEENNEPSPLVKGDDESEGDQLTSLKGTVWKLAGKFDTRTGVLQKLEPQDCVDCFTLWFDTEYTVTVINISTRLKLDLRSLNPPDAMDKEMQCDLYDKDGKINCADTDDFRRSIQLTRSYSVTDEELKLWAEHSYLLFIPHDGENPSSSRRGTRWRLSGMVDVQTGELKELEPTDCEGCYTIGFIGNHLIYVHSIWANLYFNLLSLEREYIIPTDDYPGFIDLWDVADGDKEYYKQDSYFFRYGIDHVKSCELTPDELKFYFVYNEKSYYLLFKCVFR